jgi:DNA-binding response OmpR family regulator
MDKELLIMARILVVDDDIYIAMFLQKFMISRSHEAHMATNGKMAIKKVKELMPQLVLLDIMMPGIGGIDTLKEIKKIDPKITVLMVTAIGDEELAIRTLQLGADAYITKPINLEHLESYLRGKCTELGC